MPELATKADIAELHRVLDRRIRQLTVRLGVLMIVCLVVAKALTR